MSAVHQQRWDGERQRLFAINLAGGLGPLGTLAVTALRDVQQQQTLLSLSLFHALGPRASAGASSTRRQGAQGRGAQHVASWQQALPDGPGLGLQLAAEGGDIARETAQVLWQTDAALLSAGVSHRSGGSDARAGVSGGIAWLGNELFASRRIDGSFAVVEVGGYPNLQVLHDHRPVARTDARGRALVPSLRGNESNRIAIDPGDLPFDAEVEATELFVQPPARSGIVVALPVRRTRAASFRLVGRDGQAVPAGSRLQAEGDARSFPIGFDGRAFAFGLAANSTLIARWPGHACRAQLTLPPPGGETPDLGTLQCE